MKDDEKRERFSWAFIAAVMLVLNSAVFLWMAAEQLFFADDMLHLERDWAKYEVVPVCSALAASLLLLMMRRELLTDSAFKKLLRSPFLLPLLFCLLIGLFYHYTAAPLVQLAITCLAAILPFTVLRLLLRRKARPSVRASNTEPSD